MSAILTAATGQSSPATRCYRLHLDGKLGRDGLATPKTRFRL